MNMRCITSSKGIACALVAGLALMGGYATASADPPASGDLTFAAHEVHGGLAIDRMQGGKAVVATAPGWLRMPGSPTLVLRDGNKEEGALWLKAPAEVVVRSEVSGQDPVERVTPSWESNALRLTIEPASGPHLTTDVFRREDLGAGPRELTRNTDLSIDLEGSYRAVVRLPDGTPVGWLRARVDPHGSTGIAYEGVLPPQVDEALAVASAEALSSEIDYIQDHAYGTHRGTRRP
jgi:hypothetical protein